MKIPLKDVRPNESFVYCDIKCKKVVFSEYLKTMINDVEGLTFITTEKDDKIDVLTGRNLEVLVEVNRVLRYRDLKPGQKFRFVSFADIFDNHAVKLKIGHYYINEFEYSVSHDNPEVVLV